MRKTISIMAVAAALLVSVTSCSKNEGNPDAGKTGDLKITFSIDGSDQPTKAAPVSTARPKTSWSNISNMMILFVNSGTNIVADAREITGFASGTAIFQNVAANSSTGWDCYIVGNYPSTWSAGYVVGKNVVTQLTITAPLSTSYATGGLVESGATAYDEVPEIFVAKQSGVKIIADGNSPLPPTFKLARAISLLRVRIDKSPNNNNDIDFATAQIAVRRATTTYSLSGTYNYTVADGTTGLSTFPGTYTPAPPAPANVFYKAEAMKTTPPPVADYDNGGTILQDGITLWNDYQIWPGGGLKTDLGSLKFDIVISGVTAPGTSYIPFGKTTAVPAGTRVFWTGAVQQKVGPNQILELVITLNTAGSDGPVTPVGEYGDLSIAVQILPWGDIQYVDMPL